MDWDNFWWFMSGLSTAVLVLGMPFFLRDLLRALRSRWSSRSESRHEKLHTEREDYSIIRCAVCHQAAMLEHPQPPSATRSEAGAGKNGGS